MVNYLEHRPMEPFQNYWIVIATPCGFSGFIASGSSSIVTLRSVSAATFASKTDPSGNDTFAPPHECTSENTDHSDDSNSTAIVVSLPLSSVFKRNLHAIDSLYAIHSEL